MFRKNRLYVCTRIIMTIIQGFYPVINAVLPKYLLDAILVEQDWLYFIFYLVLAVSLEFTVPLVYSALKLCLDRFLFEVNVRVTTDMLDKVYGMYYGFYDDPETSNVINRAFGFATGSGVNTFQVFLDMIAQFITISSYIYIVAKFNWPILFLIAVSIVLNYLLMLKRTKLDVAFNNENVLQQRRMEYYKQLILNKNQAKDIHFNGNFKCVKDSYIKTSYRYNREFMKNNIRIFGLNQMGIFFQSALTFGMMFTFGHMLFVHTITMGEYTVLLNASMQFSNLIFGFINSISSVYTGVLESENYSKFLNLIQEEEKKKKYLTLLPYKEKIKINLDHVSYRYYGEEDYAIKDVSYEFCEGNVYAILGSNGSGKSTLIKLLLGLYYPSEGKVMVNGFDLSKCDLEEFYEHTMVVSQDFQFLDGISIRDNLCIDSLKKETVFRDYINQWELSGVNNIDMEFSKMFHEKGLELSGGEKQKLANIRAKLRNARIAVLDEPTSAIDAATEKKIFQDLCQDRENRITIYITHNYQMAQYADKMIFLDKGKLV